MKKKELSSYEWVKFYSIRDFNNTDFWKTKSAAAPWIGKVEKTRESYPSGIYLYGFIEKINGKNLFAPYYVGKSGNIFDRLYNHLAGLRGCSLAIFKRNEIFSEEKNFNNSKINKPLNYGSLSFFKNFLDDEKQNLGKEIREEIDWMMEHWVVTWTIETNSETRKELERKIGEAFDTKYLITKIGSPHNSGEIPDQIKIEEIEGNQSANNIEKVESINKTIKKIILGEISNKKPFYEIEEIDCHEEARKILTRPTII